MATKRPAKKTTATTTPARKVVKKSTTSKAATKKTVKPATRSKTKSYVSEASIETKKTPTVDTSTVKAVKIKKPYVGLVILILLLGALLYFYRGLFVAAVVNGQPISRLEVVKQTEQQSGKQTLDTLVRNILIEQKARQANVTVSDKEINDEIKKLEDNLSKQGQKLDQVLQVQGMSRTELQKLIRLDKLVAKMVGKDIKVTDEEVTAYIEKNRDVLPQGTDEATLKKQVAEQLKQQKTNEKVRNWLADLQKQATIKYYVQY